MIRTTPFHARIGAAQRDRPVGALVEPPGRRAVPAVREVRVLRHPQRRRPVRHVAAVQVPVRMARTRSASWPASWPATSGPAAPGQAQYTLWCDDRGFVVEDGVVLRHAHGRVPAHRGGAQPRLLRGPRRPARRRDRGRLGRRGPCSPPGPAGARLLAPLARGVGDAALLRPHGGEDRRRPGPRLADRLHRRPGLRGLGPAPRTPCASGTRSGRRAAAAASCRSG